MINVDNKNKGDNKMTSHEILEKFLKLKEFQYYENLHPENMEFLAKYCVDKLNAGEILRTMRVPMRPDDYINQDYVKDAKDLLQEFRGNFFTKPRREGFGSFKNFLEWWCSQENKCYYCGVDQKTVTAIDEKKPLSKKFWATLQVERKIPAPEGKYTPENCVLACPICNNAKSDMISSEDYKIFFADTASEYWELLKARLENVDTKTNLCDSCAHIYAECDGHPKFGDAVGYDNVYKCDEYKKAEDSNAE